ncbi:MAG: glycosyltransferase [Paracoccus sp. (in: a-proteobacteria)]|uniref:glycosyltransferase n=1 Tax=Paracoccus sp. TaxID=267 RepID=UPI0039E60D47
MPQQITILMATYDGATYLAAQIDSLLAQTDRNWRLLVSDDGSHDETRAILDGYARGRLAGRLSVIDGPGQGATANFLSLIRQAETGDWIAFCDQDDIWHPEKLARARAWLSGQAGPAVYAARTTICDQDMHPLGPAPHFPGPFGFRNALVQACLPGNTTLVNALGLALLQAASPAAEAAGIVSHDWWVYQIMAGADARIHRDAAQVLLYRQHPGNVMGRNDTTSARAARASMLFDGTFAGWLAANQAALEAAAPLLSLPNRQILRHFREVMQAPGPLAFSRMLRMGLYRQTRPASLALYLAALAGRLRGR